MDYIAIFSSILVIVFSNLIYLLAQPDTVKITLINHYIFSPTNGVIVTDPVHVPWRKKLRKNLPTFQRDLKEWLRQGFCPPEFSKIVPPDFFREISKDDYGKAQVRSWRTIYARNMGQDTKLAKYFKESLNVLDSLPVEISTIGYSWLSPMRGDRTHFGEFRGTWRDLLTINYTKTEGRIYLGMYPHSLDHECDSILMTPELFLSKCQPKMKPPLVYEYKLGEDILWDDTVWHFIDNKSKSDRIALWLDIVRTDLTIFQKLVTKLVHLFPNDVTNLVNGLDYKETCEISKLDTAQFGPVEQYDRGNLVNVNFGF